MSGKVAWTHYEQTVLDTYPFLPIIRDNALGNRIAVLITNPIASPQAVRIHLGNPADPNTNTKGIQIDPGQTFIYEQTWLYPIYQGQIYAIYKVPSGGNVILHIQECCYGD